MLYNTPLEPGLQISVNSVNTQIAAVGAFNTLYFLAYPGQQSNLPSYSAELITSLDNYRERIGNAIPTDYLGLVNYLSIAAAYKNLKNTGAIKVIAVRAPSNFYTLTVSAVRSLVGTTASYKLVINGITIEKTIDYAGIAPPSINSFLASTIAEEINNKIELKNSVYIREVVNNTIEIVPFVEGQPLVFANFPSALNGTPIDFSYQYVPGAIGAIPEGKDYIQALTFALTEESELGVVVAPGFYATASNKEALLFTKLVDSFCKQAEYQQLFIRDVPNPDLLKVPEFSTITPYSPTLAYSVNSLFSFAGQIYKTIQSPVALSLITNGSQINSNARGVLPSSVTIAGLTGKVLQNILNSPVVIANINAPTSAELNNFSIITEQQIINENLFSLSIEVIEKGSATEQALYDFRDNFNSIEGHVSIVAPYQKYLGPELSLTSEFLLPASTYQAALWIYVANSIGVFTPPASDDFTLEATNGPIWQVSKSGHALLNGKGINIIKTINSNAYVMGSRTLSQNDLYNRQNARVILSLYVRTLKTALKAGLVLKPLSSGGAFLESLKVKADRVSRAFYSAGLLDGASENEAFNNKCDASINPLSALQTGVIRLESKIAQIGMTEKIVVTVQESLIGSLNTIV